MPLTWLHHKDFINAYYRSANLYTQLCRQKTLGKSIKFNPVDVQIIEQILAHSDDHRNMKWYADRIGLSASSFTQYVTSLCEKGALEKYHTAENRKDIILKVSEAGLTAYREYVSDSSAFFQSVFSGLDQISKEDMAALTRVMTVFAEGHSRKLAPARNDPCELIKID